jgi:monofunctional biosynthetic peptidoglycan transglycosylase
MGGLSSATLCANAGGWAEFSGIVSLANNGGFASLRRVPSPGEHWNLAGKQAIRLIARGDGRPYKLSLIDDAAFDAILHQASFVAQPGDWQTIDLPFAQFIPRRRGRAVTPAPALDVSAIRSFGLMTEQRLPGAFRLDLLALLALPVAAGDPR